MIRKLIYCATLALAAPQLAQPASAHVTLEVKEAKPGSGYKAVFRVPHGCDGSATTGVSVEIPEGFIGVKPMPKPGWTVATESGPYARAYKHYHGDLAEGVKRVTWSGGRLLDEHFDEFVVNGFVAREIAGADVLHFPVRQTCEKGETYWAEIAAEGQNPHSLDYPAATLLLAASEGDAPKAEAAVTAGDLAIEGPWARATPPGAKAGAGYVRITNKGKEADRLTGAALEGAGRVELHETRNEDGVMKMREREDGVEIAPGETVEFAPGGLHLMFLELGSGLVEGETARGKLTFEKAGEVAVEFPIRRAAPGDGGGHEHHHH
jgi:uncharacterized protein YcnI